MQKFLRVLESLALVALIILIGEISWTIHRIRPKLEVTISNIDRTVIVMGAAATHLEKAAGTWEQASKTQAEETSQAMSNVSAAASQLTTFVSRTDDSVNSLLLPTLTSSIEAQNASLLETQKELRENLYQMGQATAQLQSTLADADKIILNPNIKESIDNLNLTAQNVAKATSEGAATMQTIHTTVDYEAKELMRPVKKVQAVWHFVVRSLGRFFGF